MVAKCCGRCFPGLLSLWLPQIKGPALSAATEQAMKGSLSERHKEETWLSGTELMWFLTCHANFDNENLQWILCSVSTLCVLHVLHWHFSEQNENLQVELNGWEWKNRIQSHVVGWLAYYRKNTNEAIWPERQVNEECWLKKRAECRIKGLSSSLWAMLCADSCFNKTLRGGSGYQVASDKKAHDKKGRSFTRGGLVHTWVYTNRHIEHIKHSYTIRITHREEQVACHRLVTNGIGRPV